MIWNSKTQFRFVFFLFFLAVAAVYAPSLQYDFVDLDDFELVTLNPHIKTLTWGNVFHLFTTHPATLYVPLTMLSFSIDYQIWGLSPFGFHLTNLVFHFLNSCLLFVLVRLLTRNYFLAFSVSLIFIVHPIQIESVVWISERKNMLATFFLLSALIFYFKAGSPSVPNPKAFEPLFYSLLAFLAAAFSRPSSVTFVFLVPLMNYFIFDNQHGLSKRHWFYAAILIISLAITYVTIKETPNINPNTLFEKYEFIDDSYLKTVYTALVVFWKNVKLLLLPSGLNIFCGILGRHSFFEVPVLLSFLGLCGFFSLIVFFGRREGKISFWLGWFLVNLLPTSNLIFPLPTMIHDHFLYVPMIGFFAAFFLVLEWAMGRLYLTMNLARLVRWGFLLGFVFYFTMASFSRLPVWKNSKSFWEAALNQSLSEPNIDERNLRFSGFFFLRKGDYHSAIKLLELAVAIRPNTKVYTALGMACFRADQLEKAEFYLKKALPLDSKRAALYGELGMVYIGRGRSDRARMLFEKASVLDPKNVEYQNKLAQIGSSGFKNA
jgi:hypothetical protein